MEEIYGRNPIFRCPFPHVPRMFARAPKRTHGAASVTLSFPPSLPNLQKMPEKTGRHPVLKYRVPHGNHQNADQLGSLAGLSFPAVHVGVVECAPASLPPRVLLPDTCTQDGWFETATKMRDGQTSPHMPRLVVPHSTRPSLSPFPPRPQLYNVCVCLLLQDLVQSCLRGGGGRNGRTCATRDDEPRPVWTRLPITH
jgi:hypothetical protein